MSIRSHLLDSLPDIIQRYQSGQSIYAIAKVYNTNSGNIYPLLNEQGLIINKRNDDYGKSEEIYGNDIKALGCTGYSCYKIAKTLGISNYIVCRLMKKFGLFVSKSTQRNDKLINHRQEIIDLYLANQSTNKIAKKFDCSKSSICNILSKAGIKTRNWIKYSFNEQFFDKIDTEAKAWVLGLMYTDGNNRYRDNLMRLTMTDLDIIEKVKLALQATNPISSRPGRKIGYKTQYTLAISRQGLSDKLTALGCMPNKTHILNFPSETILPIHLRSHFIRGILDGDGSVGRYGIYIIGTIKLLQGIVDSCRYLKINFTYHYLHNKQLLLDYSIRRLHITKRTNICPFLTYLYDNATIYGNRKKALADLLIQKYQQGLSPSLLTAS